MSGGRIPKAFIDDLLVRVDIVDLIDTHVPLKKTGANYTARCPFHTEKSPSFTVNRNKQFFHCFGCGASGNAIGFLMDFNHLDFVEAVEDLAAFVGLDVPREVGEDRANSAAKTNINHLYQLMEQVADFYVGQLRASAAGKKAVAYLKQRGVKSGIAGEYNLGYAPDAWDALSARFDQAALLEAGLLVQKDNAQVYDRFRGRIMFPIRNKRGRVVGFGGRVLDDSLPKYLNSPETALFHKGSEVYGLYELLKKNAKPARILLVEGYMDVIALAEFGIDYAVATLGTAATAAHFDLLFRFAPELVFCFDGDNAGRAAAWRAVTTVLPCLKGGRSCRVMLLPAQHDPDTLVREEGLDAFTECVATAQGLSDYFFEHFTKDLKSADMESRSVLRNEAEAYLTQLPISAFREMMFEKLSALARQHVSDNEAILALRQREKKHRLSGRPSLPSFVMALLVQNPKFIGLIEEMAIDWDQVAFDGIEKFISILHVISTNKPGHFGALLELYRGHGDELIVKKLAALDLLTPEEGMEAEFCGALERLMAQARLAKLEQLLAKDEAEGLSGHEQEALLKMLANK
jgi:DNA primase